MIPKSILASWPIRKKLFFLLSIIFVPSFAMIVASGIERRQDETTNAQRGTMQVAQDLAEQQKQIATATETMLNVLAHLREVRDLNAEACDRLFTELQHRYPFYSVILAARPDGNVFAASVPFKPGAINLGDRKHFKDAVRTLDFSVGEYVVGRVSGALSLNYGYPVLDGDKKLIAVLITGFSLGQYSRFVSKGRVPAEYTVTFTDWKGVQLFKFPSDGKEAPGTAVAPDWFHDADGASGGRDFGVLEKSGRDGQVRISAFRQLRLHENSPPYMYILVQILKGGVVHHANMQMFGNLLILWIMALIAAGLGWAFGELILAQPIHRLVAATQNIGRGEMSTRTGLPHTSDELGQLAKCFDDTVSLLEQRNIERQNAEEALRKSYAELGERVEERTADLSASNAALTAEIAERERIESQLREHDKQLRGALAGAEGANRLKSVFLANMSHELRTPLNAIIGYSQMLREDRIGPDQPDVLCDLEKIERSGLLLLGIVNDVLDLSKIEAGHAEIKLQEVDMAAVLREVYTAVVPLAAQQGNIVCLDCPEEVRLAHADLPKLRQSLLNLVNNACKFTRNGRISVAVRRLRNGSGDWTEVRVSDTGIGICPEDVGKLFQPFSQVDDSTTRRYHGTGLGLAISKRFCQMMGGDIAVESVVGRGSCFCLRVPAAREASRAVEA